MTEAYIDACIVIAVKVLAGHRRSIAYACPSRNLNGPELGLAISLGKLEIPSYFISQNTSSSGFYMFHC